MTCSSTIFRLPHASDPLISFPAERTPGLYHLTGFLGVGKTFWLTHRKATLVKETSVKETSVRYEDINELCRTYEPRGLDAYIQKNWNGAAALYLDHWPLEFPEHQKILEDFLQAMETGDCEVIITSNAGSISRAKTKKNNWLLSTPPNAIYILEPWNNEQVRAFFSPPEADDANCRRKKEDGFQKYQTFIGKGVTAHLPRAVAAYLGKEPPADVISSYLQEFFAAIPSGSFPKLETAQAKSWLTGLAALCLAPSPTNETLLQTIHAQIQVKETTPAYSELYKLLYDGEVMRRKWRKDGEQYDLQWEFGLQALLTAWLRHTQRDLYDEIQQTITEREEEEEEKGDTP